MIQGVTAICVDPITLIGAGISAAGSIASGMAQSAAYRSQGQWADRQAVIDRQQGNYEAARAGDQATRQLASMRGAYTSAGVALEGSPLTILEDSAREASLDQQAIRYGATLRSQASTFEAGQARRNARSARTGAVIGAISPFVDAFSQQRQNNQMRSMIRNPYAVQGLY